MFLTSKNQIDLRESSGKK